MRIQTIIAGSVGIAALSVMTALPASAQYFTFQAVLNDGGSGTSPAITGSTIPTTDTNNFFTYVNGDTTGSAASTPDPTFGSAIVLTNYQLTATDPTTSSPAVDRTFSYTFTLYDYGNSQSNTPTSQSTTITGAYGGYGGSDQVNLTQSFDTDYDTTPLTFTFADGTYTLNNFHIVSPTGTGSSNAGATGADIFFNPSTSSTPEPGTSSLLMVGFAGMGALAFWQMRRRNAALAPRRVSIR